MKLIHTYLYDQNKFHLSPYVETDYNPAKGMACFYQYIFGHQVYIEMQKIDYGILVDLLSAGVEETQLISFCKEREIDAQAFLSGMLRGCIIE